MNYSFLGFEHVKNHPDVIVFNRGKGKQYGYSYAWLCLRYAFHSSLLTGMGLVFNV